MSSSALSPAIFSGLFDFDDEACYLRNGDAIATLMFDDVPTGIPAADEIAAARTYSVVTKGKTRNMPVTTRGFAGQFQGRNVSHVGRR